MAGKGREKPDTRSRTALGAFDRITAKLYGLLSRSLLGRFLNSYRLSSTRLLPGEGRGREMHTLSARRCRLVRAVEESRMLTLFRGLTHILTDCPARLYGLFFLFYGLVCCIIRLLKPILSGNRQLDLQSIVACGLLMLVALPFTLTGRSLAGAVSSGRAGHALFCRLLGLPEERGSRACMKTPAAMFYVVTVLGACAAVASVWISPAVIPLCILALGLLSLILSCPETGVALSALMLPVIWVWDDALYGLAALILLTWIGYSVKLLLMHRSFRLGRLDGVMLLLVCLLVGGGLVSVNFSAGGLRQGLLTAILLSDYFLIVNLMDTRTAIRRCLAGMGAAVLLIVLLSCVRLIPMGLPDWLEEYRLGSILVGGVRTATGFLDTLWSATFEQFLVLTMPWTLVSLLSCRRPLSAVPCAGLTVLCGWLIWRTQSPVGIMVTFFVCLLFALLCGHRSLTVAAALFPLAITGGLWYTYFHPLSELMAWLDRVVRESIVRHIRIWPGVFRMIADYPAGIGLGDGAFRKVYPPYAEPGMASAVTAGSLYLDILTGLGLPGLITVLAAMILFWRKSFTCLRRCRDRWDRICIIAGICTGVSLALLGVFRSVGTSPQLLFCLILTMGLCSSLASVCFDEQAVLRAERMGETPEREDCFLWLEA